MKSIPPLDRLLFDPLSWGHPRHLPLKGDLAGARQRSIVNDMIIKSYGWSVQRPSLTGDGLVLDFINQWRYLPHVAVLVAAQRHRAELSRRGQLMALPAWVRQFAQLDIVGSSATITGTMTSPGALLAWGKDELMTYGRQLPLVVRQRISLLFPPYREREGHPDLQTDPSPLLIKLAFQHAKRHPDTPDAADFWRCFN